MRGEDVTVAPEKGFDDWTGGKALDLIDEISSHGYDACVECKLCQTFS